MNQLNRPRPAILDVNGKVTGYLECTTLLIPTQACVQCSATEKRRQEELEAHRKSLDAIRNTAALDGEKMEQMLHATSKARDNALLSLETARRALQYFKSRYQLVFGALAHSIRCDKCQSFTSSLFILRCGHQLCASCAEHHVSQFQEANPDVLEVECPLSPSECSFEGRAMATKDEFRHYPEQYEAISGIIREEVEEDKKWEFTVEPYRPYLDLAKYVHDPDH